MTRKQCFSSFFLILLMFSNLGWSINSQFCQGELQQIVFVISGELEKSSCPTAQYESDCCMEGHEATEAFGKSCCQYEITQSHLELASFAKGPLLSLEVLEPDTTWFDAFFVSSCLVESRPTPPLPYLDVHKPPLFKLYSRLQFYG